MAFLLFGCAVCQFLIIQYFNFFEADIHMGVDCSWEYLKTIIIGKNGGFFPGHLLNSDTEPLIDKIFLLAAPFYRLTGNVFIAFGITNLIILAATIAIMYVVMADMELSFNERLFVINLFICPYLLNGFILQNDLSYFSCVFGGGAYYSMMILEFVMIIRVLLLKELKSRKTIIWAVVSLVLMVFTGVSSGPMMLVMVLIPAFGYLVVKTLIDNDLKVLVKWQSIYLYACIVVVVLSKSISGMLGIPYQDGTRFWTTASQFWSNIGNLFLGYMMLLSAIPNPDSEQSPMELLGMTKIFGIIIFVVLLVAVFYWLVKLIKQIATGQQYNSVILFLESIIWITNLEFTFIYTSYGELIFEKRYLIISTLCGFFLIGYFIKDLSDDLLFKKMGIIAFFIAIVGADLTSDYLFKIFDNASWKVDAMLETIESTDAGFVVTWGKELTPMERYLRVVDESRVYKAMTKDFVLENSGDYRIYDDSTEYQGPTVLIVSTDDPAAPQEVIDQFEVLDVQDYVTIYYSETNPIDISYWRQFGWQGKAK